jgi:hypothetical protein
MNWYYLELDSVHDIIDSIGTAIYGNHANELINDTDTCIDNNTPDTYPDFVFAVNGEVDSAVVNGDPVTPMPILGGYRPAHRPPQRPR